jgi:hypothetical protein
MKEIGSGHTRLGRFAAVTVPAAVISAGFGVAMLQGMVGSALASADGFDLAGTQFTGDTMELSLRGAQTATSDSNNAATRKDSALVTVTNGKITDMCLAATQNNIPVLGSLGVEIKSSGEVSLGSSLDMNASALAGDTADLGVTNIGIAQSDLSHQSTVTDAYNAGGFGMYTAKTSSGGAGVDLGGMSAKAYALTLGGLSLNNLSIAPHVGAASC